jgi:hypothetical protein
LSGGLIVPNGWASELAAVEMRVGTERRLSSARLATIRVKDKSVVEFFRDPLSGGFKLRALRAGSTSLTLEFRETQATEDIRVVVRPKPAKRSGAQKKGQSLQTRLELPGWDG